MRTLEPNTFAIEMIGVRIVGKNGFGAWALFVFYLYLYLYPYSDGRW